MTGKSWQVRGYEPGDERSLVMLFERAFGRPVSEAHYLWKLRHPSSPVDNIWLATVDGRPVFHTSAIPVRYMIDGRERVVMVSVDTMTDPRWQRRGLLTAVGRVAYERYRDAAIPFVLGILNERWGSRGPALGWEPLFSLEWLVRPLRPEAIVARRLRLPGVARLKTLGDLGDRWAGRGCRPDPLVEVQLIDSPRPEIDALWQKCAQDVAISAVRDSVWVGWRFLASPDVRYHVVLASRQDDPVGYAAYRIEESSGRTVMLIADVLAPRSDTASFDSLIAHLAALARSKEAETVAALAVPGTWTHDALRRAGFKRRRRPFCVHAVPLDPSLPASLLRDPSKWALGGADFDSL
jgi:GNAT superfamily N-acetyltransferase